MALPTNSQIMKRLQGKSPETPIKGQSIFGQIKSELSTAKGNIQKGFEKAKSLFSGVSGKEFAKAVPEELSRQVGQPQLRAYASVAPLFSLGTVKPLKPEGQFQKEIFGTDKPLSLERSGRELRGADLEKESTGKLKAVDIGLGLFAGLADVVPEGKQAKTGVKAGFRAARELAEEKPLARQAAKAFEGFKDITTKVIDRLKGKTAVSKQYIQDLSKSQDIRQAERDIILRALEDEADAVDIPTFANKVKQELLPLETKSQKTNITNKLNGRTPDSLKYESVTLPSEQRGPVANYDERIYQSPISTSAGGVHFGNQDYPNYFAHTRIEDLPDSVSAINRAGMNNKGLDAITESQYNALPLQGGTRRVIEIQSDLFQKGRLEGERNTFRNIPGGYPNRIEYPAGKKRQAEIDKLEPYRNTWHERVIREEVKQAAIDGKTKLQFPTGETAMKIEGLSQNNTWHLVNDVDEAYLTPERLKIGEEVAMADDQPWIITDVLGDGKFKAINRDTADYQKAWKTIKDTHTPPSNQKYLAVNSVSDESVQFATSKEADNFINEQIKKSNEFRAETFDISGKVDTNNPIYKFYEGTVGKYLKNKYGAELITDPQGVKWWELKVSPKIADQPVEAFGAFAGLEEDENGNLKINPTKATIGVLGLGIAKRAGGFDPKKVPAKEALENAYTKVLTNKDEALKAFDTVNHYDEILNETRFAKVQEMQMIRDDLAETVSNHPGRSLSKYANKKTGELPEVLGKGTSQFGRRGDDIVTELGFEDSETARETYQKYLSLKDRLKAMDEALKEERPFLRERKALLRTLDNHVVKASEDLPRLGTLVKDNIAVKDISGFMGGARDVYRNFKAVFGKHYDEVKAAILDPLDDAKKLHIQEQEKLIKELNENVVKKFGIEKGSKLSQWVMDFGEGKVEADEVAKYLGPDDYTKVKEAAAWFRQKYDSMLDEVNTIRKIIYPNNPDKIIPKRPDYFRHFYEMTDGFGALKNIFESPAGISPSLAGLSDFTAPRSKFLSFAQRRLGIKTERDAVGGFLNYIQSFAYAKHIDPHIGKFRRFRKDLVKGLEKQEELDPKRLNNFLEFLSDYANDLAGKTNPADRAMQKYIPGGRKLFQAITWLNRRVKANTILGNISSSIAQAFNIPQGIASAKQYSIPGAMRTLGGVTQNNAPMANSTFIKERYFKGYDQFDKGILKNTKKFAAWITQVLDEVGTKFIWNSHYEKALAEKVADPIKYADDFTRDLVAGRGIGEVPLLQKSKVFQLIAPFQLEVGNLWHVMGDFVSKKDFTAIATLFVANYLMNRVAERIRGTDVTFDPIQATIEGVNILKDEDDIGQGILKGGGRLAGEILSNVPLGQTIAGMVPQYGFKIGDVKIPTRKELFGTEGDPTRFGQGLVAVKGLQDPLYKVLPGFGGGQLKKTIEGLRAYFKGAVEDKSGSKMYDIARNIPNLIRNGLFGAYSTPEAREYFKRADTAEARIIREVKENAKEKSDQTLEDAENLYRDMKKLSKEEAREAFNDLAKENPDIAKAISKIAKEEARGLTNTDRQLLSAGVANGARAEAIYKLLKREKSKEAKAKLWTDLVKKKVITKDVAKQLNILLKNE